MRTSLPDIAISATKAVKTVQKLLKTGRQSPGIDITAQNSVAADVDQTLLNKIIRDTCICAEYLDSSAI